MSVKLPKIDRVGVVAPVAEAKLDVRVPSSQGLLAPLQAASQGVSQIADTYDKMQLQKEDTNSDEIVGKWVNERSERLEGFETRDATGKVTGFTKGVRHLDGDPVEPYAEFDDELESTRDSYIAESQLSERGKKLLEKKMNGAYNSIYRKSLLYRGQQEDAYENKTAEASIKLEEKAALDALSLMGVEDQTKYGSTFNKKLNGISNLIVKRALKNRGAGSALEDANGDHLFFDEISGETIKVKLDKGTELEIAKRQSDIVTKAVQSLMTIDTVEHAEKMMKAYGDQIDPVNGAKLTEAMNKVNIDKKATLKFSPMIGLPYDKQKAMLDKLPSTSTKDIEVKALVSKKLDAYERQQNRTANISSDRAYNDLFKIISDKQRSGEPFMTFQEMESDPMVSQMLGRVTKAAQSKALYNLITREDKKESSAEAIARWDSITNNDQLPGMSLSKFEEAATGLSNKHYTAFFTAWRNENLDSTRKTERRMKDTKSALSTTWSAVGMDYRGSNKKTAKKRNEEKQRFSADVVTSYPELTDGSLDPKEREARIRQLVIEEKLKKDDEKSRYFWQSPTDISPSKVQESTRELFPRSSDSRIKIPSKTFPSTSSNSPQVKQRYGSLPEADKAIIRKAYKDANNGEAAKNITDLQKWYEKNGK